MKKIIALIAALSVIFSFMTAFAEETEAVIETKDEVTADGETAETAQAEPAVMTGKTVTIHAEVIKEGYINREVTFGLYDGETNLAKKSVKIMPSEPSFNLEFEVPEYNFGKIFTVRVESGDAEVEYNGARGASISVQPYIYEDAEGNAACQTVFYINLYTKAQQKPHTVYYLKNPVPYAYYLSGGEIYMADTMMKDLRIKCEKKDGTWLLFSETGNVTMQFFKDNIYALKNYVGYNLNRPAFEVGGIGYLPLRDIAETFGCGYSVTETENEVKIHTTPSVYRTNQFENFVNAQGYESRTDYLIWVSKKDFKVHLFKGEKGYWTVQGSYPCTIGTDSTPTIEGQFEYIERLNRWTYPNFYCGPIMRFYNGYALHSTLYNYNGTLYDNRVGMKLSHGCIRLHPEDINYLVATVPFKTKIVITP